MKIFVSILSVIILGLSCVPCSDVKSLISKDLKQSAELTVTHSDQKGQHLDFCTPFCTCACCSVSSIRPEAVTVTLEQPESISSFHDYYFSSFVKSISLPIWQPPQLVS